MPDWRAHLRPRFAQIRLTAERENEIIEELSYHLEQSYQELCASGVSDAEAERRVLEELREPDTLEEYMRTLRQAHTPAPITPGASSGSILADFRQDVRYAFRTLYKQPGFAAAALLTLAFGIGANSAIFALVDATLLRPLPFHEPDRLVMLSERHAASPRDRVAPLNLVDWNQRNGSFEAMGGFVPTVGAMVMTGADGLAENVPRQWVTTGFFDALSVKAIVGRTFAASDDTRRVNAVVLNEAFWRTRFNADPGVVGRDIRLDGTPYTVVGVVPGTPELFGRTSLWGLMAVQGAPPAARSAHALQAIGRLKPGVTIDAAGADMASVADSLAREHPRTNNGRGVLIEPMHDAVIGGDLRTTSFLFLGVVGFVLLICCANVANLLLARATVRGRELAIRSALGAGRRRVIRQLLTESLVLSALGGALGLAVGAVILTAAPSLIPPGLLPGAITLGFDIRVVGFCAVATVFVGLLFGLAPAWQASRSSFAQTAASDSRTATNRGGGIRGLLVVAEVATAVLLLVGAGLLLRTLVAIGSVDRGYRAEHVLTMMVDPLGGQYPTPALLRQFFEAIERDVTGLPGVRSVAWSSALPLAADDAMRFPFEIVGEPPMDVSKRPFGDLQLVSQAYFKTLDVPVIAGRGFGDVDTPTSVRVCIVNEAFVRRHIQGGSPIGRRVSLMASPQAPPLVMEIVGVVRQVKGRLDEIEDRVQIYIPMTQQILDDLYLMVRSASDAEALAPSVRAAIARIDKEQLVSVRDVMTLEDVARDGTARHRFRAVLVVTFAALALLLAMVGLFGILAYSVQQRVRDFGIRRALGATTGDVLRLVAGSAIRVVGTGAVIGLAFSIVLGRLLVTLLFGVQPLDAVTFGVVTIVLLMATAASIAGPAWRAARIDPVVALRTE